MHLTFVVRVRDKERKQSYNFFDVQAMYFTRKVAINLTVGSCMLGPVEVEKSLLLGVEGEVKKVEK